MGPPISIVVEAFVGYPVIVTSITLFNGAKNYNYRVGKEKSSRAGQEKFQSHGISRNMVPNKSKI